MANDGEVVTPGQRLADLLDQRGMSNRQLAKALARERGIKEATAKSSIAKWLKDKHAINQENRLALARILDVMPSAFVTPPVADVYADLEARIARLEELLAAQDAQRAPVKRRAARPRKR